MNGAIAVEFNDKRFGYIGRITLPNMIDHLQIIPRPLRFAKNELPYCRSGSAFKCCRAGIIQHIASDYVAFFDQTDY
jgi:hypothetical protein